MSKVKKKKKDKTEDDVPQTLVETVDAEFYPGIYVAVKDASQVYCVHVSWKAKLQKHEGTPLQSIT